MVVQALRRQVKDGSEFFLILEDILTLASSFIHVIWVTNLLTV